MNLELAQVVAVHPDRRTVELAYAGHGGRVGEAQIASGVVGSDSGFWAVPSVPRPREDQAGGINPSGRTLMALVANVHGRPVVLGFIGPTGNQMTFREQDRAIYRHPSGAYVTVAPDGSIEARHPGGAHLRIGTGASENLGGQAANGWSTPGASPPQITLTTSGFTLTVEPGGKTTLTTSGEVEMTYPKCTMNGPIDINGVITLDGSMTATGEVTASGIPLSTHRHMGVQPGGGNSGTPVA